MKDGSDGANVVGTSPKVINGHQACDKCPRASSNVVAQLFDGRVRENQPLEQRSRCPSKSRRGQRK